MSGRRPGSASAVLTAALCLAAFAAVGAQAPARTSGPAVEAPERAVRFLNTGVREGLANASVSSIVQDAAGFIWLGTQGGLHRWDGSSFTVYENEPFDDTTLPHNLIQTMFLDADGSTIWLGTYGGLVRFDTRTGSFDSWSHDPADERSLSNDVVVAVARDGQGRLWVGTLGGLDRMDDDGLGFTRYRASPENPRALSANVIRALHLDTRGRFWVGTSGGGLLRYLPEGDSFERYATEGGVGPSLPSDYVMDIDEAADGSLWLALWFYGAAKLEPDLSSLTPFRLADERSYFINAREPGYVRVGSWGGGLFELGPGGGEPRRYRRTEDYAWSLPHDTMYSMLVDRSGEVWVGSNGGGLSQMLRDPESFVIFEHNPKDPATIGPGKVNAILEDGRGRLWVGSYNGGLAVAEPGSSRFTHYRHNPAVIGSLPNDIVTKIYEDGAGEIFVLTNGGIARYRPDGSGFDRIQRDPNRPGSLPDNIVYEMLEEPGTGNFWIGMYTGGLAYWDRRAGRFDHYPARLGEPGALGDNLVYALAYDARGRLWVGTNGGLFRREDDGSFAAYRPQRDTLGSLPSRIVRGLRLDAAGRLWVATNGGGVALYLPETDGFRYWTKRDGLPSNVVLAVSEGADGTIWASTVTGLAFFEEGSGRWRPFGGPSDLRYNEFTVGYATGAAGSLYFGAVNALYRIDSRRIARREFLPPVRVTRILVDNQAAGELSPWFQDEVAVPHNAGSVSFEFAALDYRDPARNQFAYKLEGLDEDWIYSGSRAYAAYTNLRPGRSYVFRVIASNNEGVWNDEGARLVLRVRTSPWLSWWAIALYLAAGIAALWFAAALRSRAMLKGKVDELSKLKGELEEANVKLEELASRDGLTGLPNRRSLNAELERRYGAALSMGEPLAVLMIDIDCFKPYNDRYGHQAGDEALMAVATAIRASLERPQDSAARYGGEEFAVVLPGAELGGATKVAERIRAAVEALGLPHAASTAGPVVTVSVGAAAAVPDGGLSQYRLLDLADAALYRSKAAGRNRIST